MFSYLSESQSTAVATPAWRSAPIPDASAQCILPACDGRRPHVFLQTSTAACLLSERTCGMQCLRVAGLVLMCTTCFSATKSAVVLKGSSHNTHQRALQTCYQCHLHRLQIGCSGSRSRSARPSRLVWSMKKLMRLLLSSTG